MKIYHYTSREGAEGITRSKRINKTKAGANARRGDIRLGDGVYLTTLTPNEEKASIAQNNYDGKKVNPNMMDKVAFAFELTIDDDDPKLVDGRLDEKVDGRDVFVYQDDIDLNKFAWRLISLENEQ